VIEMARTYRVGDRVTVNVGGCVENRTEGVIRSVRNGPFLTTYEVGLPEFGDDGRVEALYMAHDLAAID
jgi:hypothetical protein